MSAQPPTPPLAHWFEPRRLYEAGYPEGLTSALQVFGALRNRLRDIVASLEPEYALEVGPGNLPVLQPGAGTCYLDVSHTMLRDLRGLRVEADILRAPFFDGMFDLVLAADVFTHIAPQDRAGALREMVRVGQQVIVFNPEPGAEDYASMPVASKSLAGMLEELGCRVDLWPLQIPVAGGSTYSFGFIFAQGREG